ncbi:hypothetical protein HG530_003524 [Fusarium avenaceum]|nr:hypothetical protein HG530_003524 [Fusarium avenaceum]
MRSFVQSIVYVIHSPCVFVTSWNWPRLAEPLNVDLVEDVGLENKRRDNTGTGCGLHCDLDTAKHDVEERSQLRCIVGTGYCEGNTLAVVFGGTGGGEGVDFAFGEVDIDAHAEGIVCRAAG